MNKLKIFLITELFVLSFIAAHFYFYSRGVLTIIFLLNIFIFLYVFNSKIFFKAEIILILFPVIIITIFSYYNEFSFSIWQILRSQMWLPISFLILIFSRYSLKNIKFIKTDDIATFISIYIITIFILFNLDIFFNFNLSFYLHSKPSFLDTERSLFETTRIFFPLIKPIAILVPILFFHKKYFTILMLAFLVFITFTKTIYFPFIFFTVSALLFFKGKQNEINFNYKVIFLYVIFIITIFYIFYVNEPQFVLDRMKNLFLFSESSRGIQIDDAMNKFYENKFNMIFGYGLGTAYREVYSIDPNINISVYRALINLNYDIENGHVALLFRFGIFGCLVYIFGIYKHFKNYNVMIFTFLLIDLIGTSKDGITSCLEMFSLGLLVSFYQKINDETHKIKDNIQNNG